MTPEERQLVRDLFERLAQLEREPRDPDAERLIREGLGRAPNAVYALVQSVLLQDEALKAADAHIAELQDSLARAQAPAAQSSSGSFLGDRRAAGGSKWNTGAVLGGGGAPASSVPSVGGSRGDQPMGAPPGYDYPRNDPYGAPPGGRGPAGGPWQAGPGGGPYQGGPGGPYPAPGTPSEPPRGGGSGGFLGTAAAVAAGAIGGGLLMGGIRSALGNMGGGRSPAQGAFDQLGTRPGAGSASGGSMANEAGLNDIGRNKFASHQDQSEDEDDENEDEEEDDGDDENDFDHDDMHDSYEDDQA